MLIRLLKLVPKIAWASLAAILLLGVIFSALFGVIPTYAEICEVSEREHEHCAYYNIALFSFIKITKFLDDHGGALTALATIAIAWFTLSLRDATAEQGRLTQQSIELARHEFISTHRPKIIVRNVSTMGFVVSLPINVRFMYINIGETRATIAAIDACVFLRPKDSPIPRGLRLQTCEIRAGLTNLDSWISGVSA